MQEDSNRHLSDSLEAISVRIARLSIGLGVDLNNTQMLSGILSQPAVGAVAVERRRVVTDAVARPSVTAERRVAHLKEELRALVVLRYRLESASLQNNGLDVTRELLEQAHHHLHALGFKAGADGWQSLR